MFKEILELIFLCIIFIGVLWLTYFVTKKIGTANQNMHVNKNMKIIEVLPLMQGQYLYIVKVGEGYYLIGCTQKGTITYLKQLEEDKLNLDETIGTSFQQQFMHFMKGKQVLKDEKEK